MGHTLHRQKINSGLETIRYDEKGKSFLNEFLFKHMGQDRLTCQIK